MKNARRWIGPALVCLAAAHAGCGGAAVGEDPAMLEPEREDPAVLESELTAHDEELDELLEREVVDCARACELGDAICSLSGRICGIAERHPEDADVQRRCTEASGRCDLALERVSASCACGD